MWSRSVIVIALLATWVATPALACLPNPRMTKAEMDCCKKMAGDCRMGAGKHPCCKSVTTAPAPTASIQARLDFTPPIALVAFAAEIDCDLRTEAYVNFTHLGLPPPAPPGTDSILRI